MILFLQRWRVHWQVGGVWVGVWMDVGWWVCGVGKEKSRGVCVGKSWRSVLRWVWCGFFFLHTLIHTHTHTAKSIDVGCPSFCSSSLLSIGPAKSEHASWLTSKRECSTFVDDYLWNHSDTPTHTHTHTPVASVADRIAATIYISTHKVYPHKVSPHTHTFLSPPSSGASKNTLSRRKWSASSTGGNAGEKWYQFKSGVLTIRDSQAAEPSNTIPAVDITDAFFPDPDKPACSFTIITKDKTMELLSRDENDCAVSDAWSCMHACIQSGCWW